MLRLNGDGLKIPAILLPALQRFAKNGCAKILLLSYSFYSGAKTVGLTIQVSIIQYFQLPNFAVIFKSLFYRPAIQKFLSSLLLVIFTISIAPKLYFHDMVAHHKDRASCYQTHTRTVLHQMGYNCHFDDLVVTAPFLQTSEPTVNVGAVYIGKNYFSVYTSSFQHFVLYKDGRGPPDA